MLTRELERTLAPVATQQKMLWIVLTGMNLAYVVLAYLFSSRYAGTASPPPSLAPMLAILAAGIGVVSLGYQRVALADGRLRRRLADAADLHGVDDENPARSITEARSLALARHLRTTMVVSLALNELVALVGLVLAFLTGQPVLVLPFVIAAVLLNIGVAPRLIPDIEDAWARIERERESS